MVLCCDPLAIALTAGFGAAGGDTVKLATNLLELKLLMSRSLGANLVVSRAGIVCHRRHRTKTHSSRSKWRSDFCGHWAGHSIVASKERRRWQVCTIPESGCIAAGTSANSPGNGFASIIQEK
jgi:hypothetical protein